MSRSRRERRSSERYFAYLSELLMGFYTFLEREEKPSDEQVRTEFKERNSQWKFYCRKHGLNEAASLMFNNEVAVSWKERYGTLEIQDGALKQ